MAVKPPTYRQARATFRRLLAQQRRLGARIAAQIAVLRAIREAR